MQFASIRSPYRTQRRSLRSSNATHKPPAGAAASQYQDQYVPMYEDAPKPKPRLGGGWAKGSSTVKLTPEEAAMRDTIQQSHPLPPAKSAEPPVRKFWARSTDTQVGSRRNPFPQDSPTRPLSLDWSCQKCQTLNNRSQNNCRKCNRPKSRPDAAQWRCSSCGWQNPFPGNRCSKCNSFNAEEAQSGEMLKTWKHVQRYRQDPEPGPPTPASIRAKQMDDPRSVQSPAFDHRRSNDEGDEIKRRERLEQTRGGRFVGFSAAQDREDPKKLSSGAQVRSWQSQQRETDRPLKESVFRPHGSSGEARLIEGRPSYSQRPSNIDQSSDFSNSPMYPEHEQRVGEPRSANYTPHDALLKHPQSRWNAYNTAADTLNSAEKGQRPLPRSVDLSQFQPEAATDPSNLRPSADGATLKPKQPATATPPQPSAATTAYTPLGRTQHASQNMTQNDAQSPRAVAEPRHRQDRRDDGSRTGGKPGGSEYAPSPRSATQVSAPYHGEQRQRRPRRIRDDYDEEDVEYDEDREQARKKRKQQRKREQAAQKRAQPSTPIYLPEFISVGNLARVLRVRVEDFSKTMRSLGFEETNNEHLLDAEVAGLIAAEFNFEAIVDTASEDQDLQARPPAEDKSILTPRPPIVTIMGHVDHGKTTLLDYLRKSSVAASEHGGITQHIGAFSVPMPGGRLITFLDTPGHAAFLSMRQRGANVTDIVILVVAADDSVKPQTVEAIKHAQAAKVPMIVAITKVDKEDRNIDRVKQDLARYNVEIEDFGGDTQVVCVSGKTGQGLDELEENIVALADILDVRAEADGQAEGWILEAATKKAGRVATVLVKRGTIRRGDIIVAGSTWAKVRTLKNEAGVQVEEAAPGTPVEVDGWKDQPTAGAEVLQAKSEPVAKSAVEHRLAKAEKEQMAADMVVVNESRRLDQEKRNASPTDSSASTSADIADSRSSDITSAQISNTPIALPIILKADVSGSVEACVNAITALGTATISPLILRSSVGPISESDITFAASSGANIVSFNQKTTPEMYRLAEKDNVKLVEENVIYRLSELVKGKMQELLPEKIETRVLGEAEVAKGFEIGVGGRKKVMVAGCRIRNGLVSRANKVKVLRGGEGGEAVFDGVLSSLKIVKKDVTEARKGGECGMSFEGWEGFEEGDMVQCYEEKKVKQTL
ncbi:MAG: hypothetical protein Q9208_002838 [Pyrenodesmia sp. 3 TL-2023]